MRVISNGAGSWAEFGNRWDATVARPQKVSKLARSVRHWTVDCTNDSPEQVSQGRSRRQAPPWNRPACRVYWLPALRQGMGLLAGPGAHCSRHLRAFLPALHNQFVNWDDDKNFLENPHYRGLGWTSSPGCGPRTWPLHSADVDDLRLDYLLWGMNPAATT